MNLFWGCGYEATSTQELARVMGLKPGSLYNAFGNKHTLYLEALDHYRQHVSPCVFAPIDEIESGTGAVRATFANLIDEICGDMQQRGCYILNAILELSAHDPEVAARAASAFEIGQAAFQRALERAHAQGEIAPHHDLSTLAAYFMSAFQGLRLMWKVNPNRAILEGIVHITLSTLM